MKTTKPVNHNALRGRLFLTLLMMLLTTATAWATVRTVTYTISYNSDTRYWLDGSDDSHYNIGTSLGMAKTYTMPMGDVTITMTSADNRCGIGNHYDSDIAGFDRHDYTFTFSSTYYIAGVKIKDVVMNTELAVDNETKTCTVNWNHSTYKDAQQFEVTLSDSPAYRITYELNGSKNAAANPKWYETATGVASLADPTYKAGYDFGGWYDNVGFNGTPITSIAANSTGAMTLYAKWTAHTYTITYEPNGGTMPSSYLTSYTVETPTFNLPTPTRSNYYFRGWYMNEDLASAKNTQIVKGTRHADLTFYAKWEKYDENGDGTKWNPYKIRNEADLRELAEKVNGGNSCNEVYYQQTGDITITGGDWTPIGNSEKKFSGIYDGGGYTISGLRISSELGYQGLFGLVVGSSTNEHMGFIQNIILENSTIAGGGLTGGIVGWLRNGHVLNCHVRSDVTVQASVDGTSNSPKIRFGGVVGSFNSGTVTDCTSMATVNKGGHSYVRYLGGVIGYMERNNIDNTATATNCFSYGMTAIGREDSGTATNVEQVYRLRCTDGSITLPDAVDKTDGFYYGGTGYYKAGVSVPLTVTLTPTAGYRIEVKQGDDTLTPDENGQYAATTTDDDATVSATITPDPAHFSQSGDTYTIRTATGWGVFCDALQDNDTYNRFSGKTVRLGDDITVTRMAGSDSHDFCGTFDGGGHTLTFNYGTAGSYASDDYAAPFHYVSNVDSTVAAFRNLHVAGHIYTSAKYAAGLIAQHWGTVNVENCRVSTVIHSSVSGDGTHGGIEAVNIGVLNITGCVFDGKLLTTNGTDNCGGFVGWHYGGTTNISNSLYAPAAIATGETEVGPGTDGQNPSATFGRNAVDSIANSYYTRTLGTAQGTQAYVYAPANASFVPANVGAEGTAYSVSGITAYASGLKLGGRFYLVKASVSLADNANNSAAIVHRQVADVTLQGRKLYKDGSWNTLCLPFNVTLAGSPLAGATVKELDVTGTYGGHKTGFDTSDETLYLYFKDATAIEAGKPYLVKWTTGNTITSPTFTGVTVSSQEAEAIESADGRVSFIGNYSPVTLTAGDQSNLYLGTSNKLYYPGTKDKTINSLRAHFHVDLTGTMQVRNIRMNLDGSDDATGIVDGRWKMEDGRSDAWYSLDGIRLSGEPSQKGIYIYKGKKRIIK